MRIFKDFEGLSEVKNPVVTIGTFDGVHLGHQKIIKRLNDSANEIGGESVLLTFYPHPRMVLYPESHGLQLIQTQAEKMDKLRRTGLQNVVVIPFTMEFSRLTALEFVRDILVNKMFVRRLVIGYDHQFGKNREGSLKFLRSVCDTYFFEVEEISAKEIDDINISSTKIRTAIQEGNIELASSFLGEPFEISGKVVGGKKLGSSIGYPTANLEVDSEVKLLPKKGVYAVRVKLRDAEYDGMMNIGVRPTIDDNEELSTEINIFDFEGDIYNQFLTVQLLSKVREENQFASVEELKAQITKDEKFIRDYFRTA